MSPYGEIRGSCPCCGKAVIYHDSNTTVAGIPHMCNSVSYTTSQQKSKNEKSTFKNSQFFNKHRKQIGKYERKSFC